VSLSVPLCLCGIPPPGMARGLGVLQFKTEAEMRIVVSGASGMIGTQLVRRLVDEGHEVKRLVRRRSTVAGDELAWDPGAGELDPEHLAGVEAVVNLNGRNIGGGRWTEGTKHDLWSSRTEPTRVLADAIRTSDPPPRVLVNASATGYYGDRGDEILDETADRGSGFLADLCAAWETEAEEARSQRTRVVCLRLGMVVSSNGGALDRMLLPFKLGLGGPIGSGRQWWPWVGITDAVAAFRFAVENDALEGGVNVVAPQPTRCRDFTSALGRALHRPAALPAPAFAVRLALGEMADALLLASTRAVPSALEAAGFEFAAPRIEGALQDSLHR